MKQQKISLRYLTEALTVICDGHIQFPVMRECAKLKACDMRFKAFSVIYGKQPGGGGGGRGGLRSPDPTLHILIHT